MPTITLTTDFGTSSPFVAAMKGVILGVNPSASILDLSHEIPPQDLRHVAFFLAESLPYFPANTIHVVVVDPEVGTERAILYVEVNQVRLLAPDNGCWTRLGTPHRVIRLAEPRFWRSSVSNTFHGRDIFAPVAAHLSVGGAPGELGPAVTRWRELPSPSPTRRAGGVAGEVIFVDHYGNLITNISGSEMTPSARVLIGELEPRSVRAYADAAVGELVTLVSSSGLLEIAEVNGSAARRLGKGVGTPVHVTNEL